MNNYIKGNCTITWEELAEMQGKIVVDKVEYEELIALRAKLDALKTERDNLLEQLDTQKKAWVLRSASLHKTIDDLKKKVEV